MPSMAQWDEAQVQTWLESLGLGKYTGMFSTHRVHGQVLPFLDHDDLIEIGVQSVGHRVRILRAIGSSPKPADVGELQQRLELAERLLRKISDSHSRLRSDLLPVFRRVKEQEPLPTPLIHSTSSSTISAIPAAASSASAAAATAASAASAGGYFGHHGSTGSTTPGTPGGTLPVSTVLPKRSKSNMKLNVPSSFGLQTTAPAAPVAAAGAVGGSHPGHPSQPPTHGHAHGTHSAPNSGPNSGPNSAASMAAGSTAYLANSPTASSNRETESLPRLERSQLRRPSAAGHIIHVPPRLGKEVSLANKDVSLATSNEPYKGFRVGMDDPCHKVLPMVMRKYNINAPPHEYRLLVSYGDQEREVEDHEKPLHVYKELQDAGNRPLFMVRQVATSRATVSGTRTPGGVL